MIQLASKLEIWKSEIRLIPNFMMKSYTMMQKKRRKLLTKQIRES